MLATDERKSLHMTKTLILGIVIGVVFSVLAMNLTKSNPAIPTSRAAIEKIQTSSDTNTGSLSFGQADVCIPASGSSGLGYAEIIVPADGTISGVTLFYQTGSLNHCSTTNPNCIGKWGGQKSASNPNGNLNIYVTRDSSSAASNILYPATGTSGFTLVSSTWGFYSLTGYDAESDVVVISGPSYSVNRFEKLRLYYGEPLLRPPSSDNSGETCAGVALTYSSSSMSVSYLSSPSLMIPTKICMKAGSGSTFEFYFRGYFNGKPQWVNPDRSYYIYYDTDSKWEWAPSYSSTGYSRCPNTDENPFTCDWTNYDVQISPFPC